MRRYGCVLGLAAGLICVSGLAQQGVAPGSPPVAKPAPKRKILKLRHLTVDLVARRITLNARVPEVSENTRVLEYFLCKTGNKDYESALVTDAEPSEVHAALLALGLAPGKPARWSGGEPSVARFLPPQGPGLKITLRWKDKAGKNREADAGNWLVNPGRGKTPPPKKWIFAGSLVLPGGRYLADIEGDIMSISSTPSSVIDIPFKSSLNDAERELVANEKMIPPAKTAVQVVITPFAGAERSPHARALLEIDRFGRMKIDSKAILPAALTRWAGKFVERHEKAMVQIRPAGRAMVADVLRARTAMRIGGIREFDELLLPAVGTLLPRTPRQLDEGMKEWAEKFANPGDYITPPHQKADAVLRQVEAQLRELEARKKLWRQYRDKLRESMKKHVATTRPAPDSPGPQE